MLHIQPPTGLIHWPPLLQVHKFINRNRDHLDPAMLELLRQSQLQVTSPSQALNKL